MCRDSGHDTVWLVDLVDAESACRGANKQLVAWGPKSEEEQAGEVSYREPGWHRCVRGRCRPRRRAGRRRASHHATAKTRSSQVLKRRRVRRSPDCSQGDAGRDDRANHGRHTHSDRKAFKQQTAIFDQFRIFGSVPVLWVEQPRSRQQSRAKVVTVKSGRQAGSQPLPRPGHTHTHTRPTDDGCPSGRSPSSIAKATAAHLSPRRCSRLPLPPLVSLSLPSVPEPSAPSLSPALSVYPPSYLSIPFFPSNQPLLGFYPSS